MQLGTIEAWITTDDGRLEEFTVEVSDGKVATCWIPSDAGKSFSINWKDDNATRTYDLASYITLDGLSLVGNVNVAPRGNTVVTKAGSYTSSTTSRPFLFGSLLLTDDDSYLTSSRNAAELGEIAVNIWTVKAGKASDLPVTPLPGERKVHERAKKAMGHCVKFGEEIIHSQTPVKGISTTQQKEVGTFIFKYRSLDILQANGIAPPRIVEKRRATTTPEDDVSEDDAEARELKILQDRINELQAKRAKTGRLMKKVKTKVKAEPRGKTIFDGEVIDLT